MYHILLGVTKSASSIQLRIYPSTYKVCSSEREREKEIVTRFSQPTSLITWLIARTPTILEHERVHSPSKLFSDIKEIKTIKDETENLHVVLFKTRSHSVSVRCKQSCILLSERP